MKTAARALPARARSPRGAALTYSTREMKASPPTAPSARPEKPKLVKGEGGPPRRARKVIP